MRDASYAYELHGPLRRIEIGQDSVQGIDYTYTINGWLKSINHPSSEPTMDAGRDGKPGTAEPHALFGRDAFGMMLTYHADDFKHTGSFADAATTTAGNNTWHQTPLSSLYNGNIASWSWSSRTNTGTPQPLASRYRYDVLNRIRVDTLSTRASTAWQATPNYRSSYTYDGNGNLKNLVRVDSAGTLMDSLLYTYQPNRNRLTHVDDPGGVAGNHSYDVDDQQANNYTYDATGNLTSDLQEGITSIEWTPSNKIRSITKGSTSKLEYTYDGAGNRVVKRYYQPASKLKHTTWYARDAQGNVLSIYERLHADSAIKQTEVHIYGSSRIGIEQRNITYSTSPFAWLESEQHRHAGTKRYELADHLGNVRVTFSDLLVPRPASSFGYAMQDAEVIDRRDYYPFGMEMPGRRWRAATEGAGRFGYNAQERDDEVAGEGNHYTAMFWEYDSRVARRWNLDPKPVVGLSQYSVFELNPITNVDVHGDSIDLGNLTARDKDGNLIHRQSVQAFEAFAKTKEGRRWILDRAQKGFEYHGQIDGNLSIKADREGRLSREGIDYEFMFNPDADNLGSTQASIDKSNNRLKVSLELFSRDERSYYSASLSKLNTFLHEATYHGDAFERVYREQTYAISSGFIRADGPIDHTHYSVENDGLRSSFYGKRAADILLRVGQAWNIENLNKESVLYLMKLGFHSYHYKDTRDLFDRRVETGTRKK